MKWVRFVCQALKYILAGLILLGNIMAVLLLLGVLSVIVLGGNMMVVGLALAVVISLLLHEIVWSIYGIQCDARSNNMIKKFINKLVYIIFFDFGLSTYYKGMIKIETANVDKNKSSKNEGKIRREKYISGLNIINLVASFIIVAALFVCSDKLFGYIWQIFTWMLAVRTFSRTMEINIAFFVDVISDKPKLSNLTGGNRVGLAMRSIVEEAVLFSGIYLVIGEDWIQSIILGMYSLILNLATLTDSVVSNCAWYAFIPIYQLICSLILITLCGVSYIGTIGNKHNNDR